MLSSARWAPRWCSCRSAHRTSRSPPLCCCRRAPRTSWAPRWCCRKRAARTSWPPRLRCCRCAFRAPRPPCLCCGNRAPRARAGSLCCRNARGSGARTRCHDTRFRTWAWRSRCPRWAGCLGDGAGPGPLGWGLAPGGWRRRRILAVDHQDPADVLHRLRSQASAHRLQHRCALVPVGAGRAYFDQFVTLETDLDLAQDRVGQALVSHQHHRVKGMGAGLEILARERCELHMIHPMVAKVGF